MTHRRLIALLVFMAFPHWTGAYELATHAAITYNAYAKSKLNANGNFVKILGLDVLLHHPDTYAGPFDGAFGRRYYFDMTGGADHEREANEFEDGVIGLTKNIDNSTGTLAGWLMRGAIREDDGGYALFGSIYRLGLDAEPYDDPYGNINRFCNHFFDPLASGSGAANFICPGATPLSAPTWAVGTVDAFASPDQTDLPRRNHFTVLDAREAMYRALTGQRTSGAPAGPNFTPATESVRKAYWATVFRSLGDVLHLNQDMAQPQHTRNETHGGGPFDIAGHTSFYEKYIDARITREERFTMDGATLPNLTVPYLGGDGLPHSATRYSDFWSSGRGAASLNGTGLADYSNHNFFTVNNNFGDTRYPQPSSDINQYSQVSQPYALTDKTYVYRKYLVGTGSLPNIRMTSRGAWEEFLPDPRPYRTWIPDRNVYDDMASLLLPKAVDYSAGIINYFFRGSMAIALPDEGVYGLVDHSKFSSTDARNNFSGFDKIKLKLSNTSEGAEAMSGGKLVAVLKFHRNICYTDDLSGYPPLVSEDTCESIDEEIVTSSPAKDGAAVVLTAEPQPFEFHFPKALPINAVNLKLQVVYRGVLGNEADAVVVATQNISEPTFYSYLNASDYYRIDGKVYTHDELNQPENASVLRLVQPQSCIDYSSSTPRLVDSCLKPFNINFGVTIGSGDKQTHIDVTGLQPKRYIRIAMLGDSHTDVVLVDKTSNTCPPISTANVNSLEWDTSYDAATSTIPFTYPLFYKLRGISSWSAGSCVGKGDTSPPGGTDNRNEAMKNIDPPMPPVEVKINGGNGF